MSLRAEHRICGRFQAYVDICFRSQAPCVGPKVGLVGERCSYKPLSRRIGRRRLVRSDRYMTTTAALSLKLVEASRS